MDELEATPQTEGTAAPAEETTAATPEGTATEADSEEPLVDNSLLGDEPEEGAAPEGEAKNPEDEPEKDEGAPEKYEAFKFSEGREIPADMVEAFSKEAKELNLSQAKAQKLVTSLKPSISGYLQKEARRNADAWREASINDAEFGGENFKSSMAIAGKAYKEFASPALRKLVDASGLGNHPEFVRMFWKIGKSMSGDSGVEGGRKPIEKPYRRFPHSNMIPDEN